MRSLVLALALSLCVAALARAAEAPPRYYVDPDGVGGACSDDRPRKQAASEDTPWCTLERAIEQAPPDSVVFIREGELGDVELTSETEGEAILARAYPGETVRVASLTLDGASGLRISGLTLGGVVLTAGSNDVTLDHNLIQSPGSTGVTFSADPEDPPLENVSILHNRFDGIGVDAIQAKNFRDLTIEGNEFTGLRPRDPGVHPDVVQTVFGGEALVIRANWIHDYEGQGLFIADGAVSGVTIENNLVEQSAGDYVEATVSDASGVRFANNTVRGLTRFSGESTDVTLANNLLESLTLDDSDGLEIAYEDHNLIETGPGDGANDVEGDPSFADTSVGDFELAAASPAVDAGSAEHAPPLDLFGRSRRGQPDIGALERGGIVFEGLPLTLLPLRVYTHTGTDDRILVRCSRACRVGVAALDAEGDPIGTVDVTLPRAGRRVVRLETDRPPASVRLRAADRPR